MEERRYCGHDWNEMNRILDIMCVIGDRETLSGEERDAFDIALQCITTVIIRMKEDKPMIWI